MSNKQRVLSGRNIYKDEKGRDVLYIKSHNIGYIIQEKNQQQYTLFSNRYIISGLAGILAANFNVPVIYSLFIAAGTLAFLEYRYRTNFLPSLSHIKNFRPTNNVSALDAMIAEKNKMRNLILSALYILFGVLIVLNGIQMEASPVIMAGNVLVAVAALYMGIMNFIAFIKIKS
ncbi:MAG: hypothetical protein ACOX1F_06830 [Erysipelotrichaceae bacterium]|jgi:hypothetical protein